jgi:8-oxo-dGTP pyrophosphatase MutT (NUDIX family)
MSGFRAALQTWTLAVTVKPSQLIPQSGVIPYRHRGERLEIALITAREDSRWGIPKGHLERGMMPYESAAQEAYEEAGLVGEVGEACVGSYLYEKRGTIRCVDLYSLRVSNLLDRWPEMKFRERQWMTVREAAARVHIEALGECILKLPSILRRYSMAARGGAMLRVG